MKLIGLRPARSAKKMAAAAAKIPFHSTRAKVFSNAQKDGEESDKIRVNPNVIIVREQL